MAKHTASRSEQAVSNRVSRQHRLSVKDMPDAAATRRRCPLCKHVYGNDEADALLGQMGLASRDPLIAYARLHDHFVDEDGKPNIRAALLDLCDNATREPPPHLEDLQRTMAWLWHAATPTAALLEARWEFGRSDRDIAQELGVDHKTAGGMVQRAIYRFKETMASGKVA